MKTLFWWIMALLVLLGSFWADPYVFDVIRLIRTNNATEIFRWITDFGLAALFGFFLLLLFIRSGMTMSIGMVAASVLSYSVGIGLKFLLKMPRPGALNLIDPLIHSSSYAFPSTHSAFIFAALPFFGMITKNRFFQMLLFLLMLMIPFSRVYLGVHSLSQVFSGALLGIFIGQSVHIVRGHFFDRLMKAMFEKFELRRQIAHLITGLAIVALYYFSVINWQMLLGVIFIGAIISLLSLHYRLPVVALLLDFFERPEIRKSFPGKGSFFLVFGSLLAMLLFEKSIALASITMMAVGDSLANIFGNHFGQIAIPYNPAKKLEGAIGAFLFSALAAMLFVPFEKAILGAAAAMFFETIHFHFGNLEVDDNLILPLIAGSVMSLM